MHYYLIRECSLLLFSSFLSFFSFWYVIVTPIVHLIVFVTCVPRLIFSLSFFALFFPWYFSSLSFYVLRFYFIMVFVCIITRLWHVSDSTEFLPSFFHLIYNFIIFSLIVTPVFPFPPQDFWRYLLYTNIMCVFFILIHRYFLLLHVLSYLLFHLLLFPPFHKYL